MFFTFEIPRENIHRTISTEIRNQSPDFAHQLYNNKAFYEFFENYLLMIMPLVPGGDNVNLTSAISKIESMIHQKITHMVNLFKRTHVLSEGESNCPICLSPSDELFLPCCHAAIHKSCYIEYVTNDYKNCPLCRHTLLN